MTTATAPITTTVTAPVEIKGGVIRRTRTKVAAMFAFLAVLITPGLSFATPTDATGGAGADFIQDLQTQFLQYVVPAALGLMVAVLGISVLVSWGRKAVKSR